MFKVFKIVDFQQKNEITSLQSLDFTSILSVTESQFLCNVVLKNAVLENTYNALMEYHVLEMHFESFPELAKPFVIEVCLIFTSYVYNLV